MTVDESLSVARTEFERLGIDAAAIRFAQCISNQHGNQVFRVQHRKQSLILKCFEDHRTAHEIAFYKLLQDYGVPTIKVMAQTERSILLEDLGSSPQWRLAAEDDLQHADVGAAVGRWYRSLHAAGREALAHDPTLLTDSQSMRTNSLKTSTMVNSLANSIMQSTSSNIPSLSAQPRGSLLSNSSRAT